LRLPTLAARFNRLEPFMIRSKRAVILSLSVLAVSCLGQPSEDAHEGLRKTIVSVQMDEITVLKSGDAITSAKLGADTCGAEYSWPSILSLWLSGEEQYVALLWWQQDDPETRALIIALAWSRHAPPDGAQRWTCGTINFEDRAKRFEPHERTQRLREIAFVRANLPAIRADLDALFRRVEESQRQRSKGTAGRGSP
jgi:hypothetical protein